MAFYTDLIIKLFFNFFFGKKFSIHFSGDKKNRFFIPITRKYWLFIEFISLLNFTKLIFLLFFYSGIFFSSLLLSACASNVSAPVSDSWNRVNTMQTYHKVQAGETLYSIAWRYNLNAEELASWNHLSKPYNLRIGQRLRLVPQIESAPVFNQKTSTSVDYSSEKKSFKTPLKSDTSKALPKEQGAINKDSPATQEDDQMLTPQAKNQKTNWLWPVRGKLLSAYNASNKGIDIATPSGTPVKAVAPGLVVYAGSNLPGYGQLIIIKQKDNLMTAYAHNSKLLVKEKDNIKLGQTIALSGMSGTNVPKLHFEVRKAGKPVDPLQYLTESP